MSVCRFVHMLVTVIKINEGVNGGSCLVYNDDFFATITM